MGAPSTATEVPMQIAEQEGVQVPQFAPGEGPEASFEGAQEGADVAMLS